MAAGMAALAPAVAPVVRRGLNDAYDWATSAARRQRSQGGNVVRVIRATHEPKNVDTTFETALTGSTTAYFNLLNAVSQGYTGNERTGRQVLAEAVELRCWFEFPASVVADDVARVSIVWDKECRGAQFSTSDLYSATSDTYELVMSPHNFDNVPSRFTILLDETVTVPVRAIVSSAATTTRVRVERTVKLSRKVKYYNTNAGTVADIDSGSIYMVVTSANTSQVLTIRGTARFVFRDI